MKQPLTIDQQKCTGCSKCIAACPFGALCMQDKLAVVEPELCCACGACLKACPCDAITVRIEDQVDVASLKEFKDIWVFAEQSAGRLHESAFELLAAGGRLAADRRCSLAAVVLGSDIKHLPASLIAVGADRVYLVENPRLAEYESSVYADALNQMIARYKPEVVLAAATAGVRGFFAKTAI